MTKRVLAVATAAVMLLTLLPTAASAKKPLDVDCTVLAAAMMAVDGALDAGGEVQFDSVGDLNSSVKKDPELFALLAGGILGASGGAIDFTDAKQVIPTIASCGLLPLLQELIDTDSSE